MNEAFMLMRRRRGFFEILPESPDDSVATSPAFVDQTPNPEESCWRRERRKLLDEAINRLGPKIRITILLCYIEERPLQEAAQIPDSRHISCRREDTCFSRTPEATPHRKSRAPSASVRGGAEGCNSEQPVIAKGGVSENGPRLWHGPHSEGEFRVRNFVSVSAYC